MSTAADFVSAAQDELYERIKDKPLHVDLVLLHKGRTRPHIIEKELLRIRDANSLDELKEKLLEAQESLNIFQAVQLTLDAGLTVSIWRVPHAQAPAQSAYIWADMSLTRRATLDHAY